jgi:lipopolysaccharide biosynthesis protein
MKRVAFFAHFDAQHQVKPYVEVLLRALAQVCSRVVFVSTSRLPPGELAKIQPLVEHALLKDNVGLDFGMWQHAFEHIDLAGCDELVLVNSSVVGPVFPLGPIMQQMSQEPCDFWGMTDNTEFHWHLQSYFLVFKRKVLDDPEFQRFWRELEPAQSKQQIIESYEVGLSKLLRDEGFIGKAFAATTSWANGFQRWWMRHTKRTNATLWYPLELLNAGMPFVKVALLKDKSRPVVPAVLEAMRLTGYDVDPAQL